jgi:hypothetical protein
MRGIRRGFVAIVSASALVLALMPATGASAAKSTGGEFAAHGRKKYPTVAAAQSRRARKEAAAAAAEPQLAYGGGVHGIGGHDRCAARLSRVLGFAMGNGNARRVDQLVG